MASYLPTVPHRHRSKRLEAPGRFIDRLLVAQAPVDRAEKAADLSVLRRSRPDGRHAVRSEEMKR